MPIARDYRSRTQADIMDWLTRILRTIIAFASGRYHGSRRGHRYRHRTSIPHRHLDEHREAAARRARLVKQEVSLWRLGIFVCVLIALIWVAWRIIAQTVAQSLARSNPAGALSWVTDQSTALNQLVQQELTN